MEFLAYRILACLFLFIWPLWCDREGVIILERSVKHLGAGCVTGVHDGGKRGAEIFWSEAPVFTREARSTADLWRPVVLQQWVEEVRSQSLAVTVGIPLHGGLMLRHKWSLRTIHLINIIDLHEVLWKVKENKDVKSLPSRNLHCNGRNRHKYIYY